MCMYTTLILTSCQGLKWNLAKIFVMFGRQVISHKVLVDVLVNNENVIKNWHYYYWLFITFLMATQTYCIINYYYYYYHCYSRPMMKSVQNLSKLYVAVFQIVTLLEMLSVRIVEMCIAWSKKYFIVLWRIIYSHRNPAKHDCSSLAIKPKVQSTRVPSSSHHRRPQG